MGALAVRIMIKIGQIGGEMVQKHLLDHSSTSFDIFDNFLDFSLFNQFRQF